MTKYLNDFVIKTLYLEASNATTGGRWGGGLKYKINAIMVFMFFYPVIISFL